MRSVAVKDRALCARALKHYAASIANRQAGYGDLLTKHMRDMFDAEALADQFTKEVEAAAPGFETDCSLPVGD